MQAWHPSIGRWSRRLAKVQKGPAKLGPLQVVPPALGGGIKPRPPSQRPGLWHWASYLL